MKVENNGLNRLTNSEAEGAHSLDKASRWREAANGVGHYGGKDEAILSDRARMLAKTHAALDEVPEVRSEKVEALKAQIQNGNYSIPYEEVVKRLLAQVRLD